MVALRNTIARVSDRYFDGTSIILMEESEELEGLLGTWEDLLEQFNDFIVSEFQQIAEARQVPRLDPKEVTSVGEALAVEQAAYLVDSAKAEALRDMRDDEAAIALMVRWEN